jgi:hypothetical protein
LGINALCEGERRADAAPLAEVAPAYRGRKKRSIARKAQSQMDPATPDDRSHFSILEALAWSSRISA